MPVIAITVSAFPKRGLGVAALVFPLIVLIIAVAYVVTGYLIGRRRRLGAWLAVAVGVGTGLLQFDLHLDINWISLTSAWLAVDAVLVVLVLANWRRFDRGKS